jgi:hypothetical protein
VHDEICLPLVVILFSKLFMTTRAMEIMMLAKRVVELANNIVSFAVKVNNIFVSRPYSQRAKWEGCISMDLVIWKSLTIGFLILIPSLTTS